MGVSIISNDSKVVDLKLSVHVAMHSSIRTVDHLSDMLVSIGKESKCTLQDLKNHRTKCSMLIKNVIGPSMLKELVTAVGTSYYSLLVDESTDISVCKYMAICVRYFSCSQERIVTNYLGIYEVTRATADILADSLITFIEKLGLDIKKLIGLGTDGASNLCGKNNSLYTIVKTHAPKLQLVKCGAHSLHICCSKAQAVLPSSLDYLCRESYNWFSCSPLRRSMYKETFNLINDGIGTSKNQYHQLIQLSGTRWLARAKVVKVSIGQWLELKTHFVAVVDKEKCYMARTLCEMFQDPKLLLYLVFIYPILKNVNRVNISV
jgi:hypothetical protein